MAELGWELSRLAQSPFRPALQVAAKAQAEEGPCLHCQPGLSAVGLEPGPICCKLSAFSIMPDCHLNWETSEGLLQQYR